MYLKSLALRGFKSFADRAVLKFEPGVTAIVGPNGSGKSNITDAILWALGEQSPRSLRGGSMEDVIFAGSELRHPVGMAEVILTIDNSDDKLPIDFAEVTIARRVYRDGESEYFINNSPCRLIDIQELLSGSGLGRGTYSIIGQGRIEEALQAKPEERRMFIEEAAGILKYKRRRDRAVRRLSSLDSSLIRLADILGEVKRQLSPLKRQAELAEKHNAMSEELRSLELAMAVLDLRELQGRWEALDADEAAASQKVEALKAELEEADREAEAAQALLEDEEKNSSRLAERRRRMQSVEDRLQAIASLVAERARNAEERLDLLAMGAYRFDTRRLALERKVQQSDREIESLDEAVSKAQIRLSDADAELKDAEKKSEGFSSKIKALERSIGLDERFMADLKSSASNLDLAIKTGKAQLIEQKNSVRRKLEAAIDSSRTAEGSREALVDGVRLAERDLESLDRREKELAAEAEAVAQEIASIEAEAQSARARMAALEGLARRAPDVSYAIAALGEDAVSVLGECISVKRGYEKAIEALLGRDLFCIVVENAKSVKRLVSEGIGNASLLSLDRVHVAGPDGGEAGSEPSDSMIPALSVVDYPESVDGAVRALFGNAFIARTLDEALERGPRGSTVVTLDGDVVYATGKILLGGEDGHSGELVRRREIGELASKLKAVSELLRAKCTVREKVEADHHEAEERSRKASRALESKRAALEALDREIEALARNRSALEGELEALQARIEAYEKRLTDESAKLEGCLKSIGEKEAELERKRREMEELKSARDRSAKVMADASHKVEKAEIELKALEGRRRGIERERIEAMRELAELKKEAEKGERDAGRLNLVKDRSGPLISAIQSLAVIAGEVSSGLKGAFESGEEGLSASRESLSRARERSNVARSKLEEAKMKLHEIEVIKAQLKMEVSGAISRIVDELDVPLERALEMSIPDDGKGLAERASSLRRRLAALGPVNPMAIEEHRELGERAALLEKQIRDISESRRALRKIIKAIDQKMRERFLIAFEQINAHFAETFEKLFPNGRAELVLTEPDDPDISGVDIVAQPSGKRLQRLSLLSGGEKSLASLAFLFSLYLDDPCPFFVLDEAEAALDDVNLNRLVRLLREFKEKTQYIVITHQRRTMEMADALYGVTMQADGVSKLISQKFEEAAEVV